jgi:predicted MPP superfamily phosphohydrolase
MSWFQKVFAKLKLLVNRPESVTPVAEDADEASQRTPIEVVRLLHLTDLHYGFRFNESLWRHINSIVPALKPHVILVTGDLVNSPWWWRCRKVREMLDQLKTAATGNNKEYTPRLYVIPGNHDTRILGILPVVWVLPLIAGLSILFIVGDYLCGVLRTWPWILFAAALAIGCRYVLLRKFTRVFRDLIPPLPTTIRELSLVIYPFDSATYATSGACGAIPLRQFVDARKVVGETADVPYRIAIVHHHTIPIPYDSEQENMMVLKNAGAFISEVAGRGVRLVLSGHKHHQHLSRVTINPESDEKLEVTVLNTGTPTARRHPGRFGHNFSVIDIYPRSGARITRYRSDGGAFNETEPFWAETIEGTGKALLRENTLRRQMSLQISRHHC